MNLTNSIILKSISTLIIFFVFIVLYSTERKKGLLYFSLASACFFVLNFFEFYRSYITISVDKTFITSLFYHYLYILFIAFFLAGIYNFIDLAYRNYWTLLFGIDFLLLTYSYSQGLVFYFINSITIFTISSVFVFMGIIVLKYYYKLTKTSYIISFILVIMGIHSFVTIFISDIHWLKPYLNFSYAIIQIILAISFIFLYVRLNKIFTMERDEKYKTLINSAPESIFILYNMTFIECNKRTLEMFNVNVNNIIGKSILDFSPKYQFSSKVSKHFIEEKINELKKNESQSFEWTFKKRDGSLLQTETLFKNITLNDKQYVMAIVRDITFRKNAEDFQKIMTKILTQAMEGVAITDKSGKIIFVNRAFCDMTGYLEEEVLGENTRILKSNHHNYLFYADLWKSLSTKGEWSSEVLDRKKNGEVFPLRLNINAIKDSFGKTIRYVSLFHDLTDIKRNIELIEYQKYYDALTDLPNRFLLTNKIHDAIRQYINENTSFALIALDVNNFSAINDSYGHVFGDLFLKAFKNKLMSVFNTNTTISRLGADEFIILMPLMKSNMEVTYIINKLIEIYKEPLIVKNRELFITISIGITYCDDDELYPEVMIRNADIAMQRAKNKGRNYYEFFTPLMNKQIAEKFNLENKLRKGILENQFVVYYQPKIDVKTQKIMGMEALIRWFTKEDGMMSPAQFIPISEKTGLIVPLGEFVLKQACLDTIKWINAGYENLTVSVNLSAVQFSRSNIVETVKKVLAETRLPATNLELEITESVLIKNSDDVINTLKKLRTLGIHISLDDFGTGYSSLSYLRKLPLDILKIDRSFVREIPDDDNAIFTIEAIISLAHNLKLAITAEGVETSKQVEFLKSYHCDYIQGYYYYPPLNYNEFEDALKKHS